MNFAPATSTAIPLAAAAVAGLSCLVGGVRPGNFRCVVAQRLEHGPTYPEVDGSNPSPQRSISALHTKRTARAGVPRRTGNTGWATLVSGSRTLRASAFFDLGIPSEVGI